MEEGRSLRNESPTMEDVKNEQSEVVQNTQDVPTILIKPEEEKATNFLSSLPAETTNFTYKFDDSNNHNYNGYSDILTNAMSQIISSPSQFDENCDDSNPRFRHRQKKKEKKRTESINNAFADLRRRIPNVPVDTKLSKIKTLRLATSYITYLTEVLHSDPNDFQSQREFRADLKALRTRERRKMIRTANGNYETIKTNSNPLLVPSQANIKDIKRSRGRTGWPQTVWQMELGVNCPTQYYPVPIQPVVYEPQPEYYQQPQVSEISYFSPISRPMTSDTYESSNTGQIMNSNQYIDQGFTAGTQQAQTAYYLADDNGQTFLTTNANYNTHHVQYTQVPTEFFEPTPLPPISLPPINDYTQVPASSYESLKSSDAKLKEDLQILQNAIQSETTVEEQTDHVQSYTEDNNSGPEMTYITL